MKVTVEQAAVNALGQWLTGALGKAVTVSTTWPEPSKNLPAKAVTILRAGAPEEEPLDPIIVDRVDTGPHTSLFTWRLRALRQPLQLDVWAKHAPARDDLLARLDEALNAGMGATLGATNADPFRHGVVLPLADGWSGTADCYFDRPEVADTPDAATRSEYRATLRGWAEVDLTLTAPSARLAVVRFVGLTDTPATT
ncbi:MAG: hypothetical protein ACRELB_22915 [Polyangiaceae bacterium]